MRVTLSSRWPRVGWAEIRAHGSFASTDAVIEYRAQNGHLMAYYEDAALSGKPGRQCAWESWHSANCGCGEDH